MKGSIKERIKEGNTLLSANSRYDLCVADYNDILSACGVDDPQAGFNAADIVFSAINAAFALGVASGANMAK